MRCFWRFHSSPSTSTCISVLFPTIKEHQLGLLCTILRNPELKSGTIPPKIHDLYNEDIDMRKFEKQLRVLSDLLNSCPDIASRVTRVSTLANMLAAGPLASSMFYSEVDKLVRIYLTVPVTTATGERSLSAAVRFIKTYLRSTVSQQRLNNIMLLSVHKNLTDGLALPTIARQFVDADERRRHFFGTVHSPQ